MELASFYRLNFSANSEKLLKQSKKKCIRENLKLSSPQRLGRGNN